MIVPPIPEKDALDEGHHGRENLNRASLRVCFTAAFCRSPALF